MFANPRQVALSVLNELDRGEATLDAIIEKAFRKNFTLEKRDRALTMELVYGVLRQRMRLDWIIDQFSRIPRNKIEPLVQNVLRLGVYQLFHMDRIPPSAAVNECVNLVKVDHPERIIRFVNGVLRAIERERGKIRWPEAEENPSLCLAVETSHPLWMVERWVDRYGLDEARRLCQGHNQIPVLTIRTNTLRVKRDQLLQFLKKEVPDIEPAFYSTEGVLLKGFSGSIVRLTGYKGGWFQVQDESSQLVSHLVLPRPGELVLDACAGLGGKTTHLAQMMRNLGRILALDTHTGRLDRLKENASRLGIQNIEVIKKDVTRSLADLGGGKFDRILLDAPCSGLGVIRRDPDIKWRCKPEDLFRMAARQGRLLDELALLLKPGGVLVYATCSLEPEENELVIKEFTLRHPEFEIEDPRPILPEKAAELVEGDNFLRTYPHRQGMDGFTAVRMKKRTL